MQKQSESLRIGVVLALAAALGVAWGAAGPASGARSKPAVADETCLGCHDELAASLRGTPHRLASEVQKPSAAVACVSCHAGGDAHSQDPTAAPIGNPASAEAAEVNRICESCHVAHLELDLIGFDPHLALGLSCVSCHTVHGGNRGLLLDRNLQFCSGCHVGLQVQFSHRSTHPLHDGQVTCLSCHDFRGSREPAFGHGAGANCYACHPQQSGPYLWEHEATSSFSAEGEGCIACHAPHGSANERLLTQPGDGLCRQCHAAPPRHLTAHGGIGAQYRCLDCHADVHGSHFNQKLLAADLSTRVQGGPASCFCHGVD